MTGLPAPDDGTDARARSAGIAGPLVGSAAAHFLAAAFGVLLLGAAADSPRPGFVEVRLVEAVSVVAAARGTPAAAPGGRSRGAVAAPGAAPILPPPPVAAYSPPPTVPDASPAPVPGNAVASPGAPPRGGTGGGTGGERPIPAIGPDAGRMAPARGTGPPGPSPGAHGSPVPAAGAGAGHAGGDAGAVRLLRERIESRILYPEEAVRKGQEGVVVLRIRIGEGGVPGEIRIARSSGARSLDDAARSGVVKAAPLPSIPGWFEVPVRFVLRPR